MIVKLTPREREMLVEFARGRTAVQIGWKHEVSQRTVESAAAAIRRKLGADSMAHSVALAFLAGILKRSDFRKVRGKYVKAGA